jgi:hypothetical protein
MRRIVDKEEMRVNWQLNRWYEKTVYVFGLIYTVLLVLAFIAGFVSEI